MNDAPRLGALDALGPEHRLSYEIGEIVRSDNFLESETRGLFWVLRAAAKSDTKIPLYLGRLFGRVRTMIADADVCDEFREIAIPVLDLACAAHELRNLLAHDQWITNPVRGTTVHSMRPPESLVGKVPERSIDEFRACVRGLQDAAWRMRGVVTIAPAWLGVSTWFGERFPEEQAEMERVWAFVAVGSYRADPGQIVPVPTTVPAVRRPKPVEADRG